MIEDVLFSSAAHLMEAQGRNDSESVSRTTTE
jgi:hypothetical protein